VKVPNSCIKSNTLAKKKARIIKVALYTIEVKKIKAPLFLIYTSFHNDAEIQDTFHLLHNVVHEFGLKSDSKYIALSHNIKKMMTISQLLAACAMICNSFEKVKGKNK